jgi:hypothetical protein
MASILDGGLFLHALLSHASVSGLIFRKVGGGLSLWTLGVGA